MSSRRRNAQQPVSLFSFQDIITAITGIMLLVVMLLVLDLMEREVEDSVPQDSTERQELQDEVEQLESRKDRLKERLETNEEQLQGVDITSSPEEVRREIESYRAKNKRIEERISDTRESLESGKRTVQEHEERSEKLKERREESREARAEQEKRLEELRARPPVKYDVSGESSKKPLLVECGEDEILVQGAANDKKETFDGADFREKFREWARRQNAAVFAVFVLIKPSSAPYVEQEILQPLRKNGFDVGYEPLEEDKSVVLERSRQ